jgi:hypothetical protein
MWDHSQQLLTTSKFTIRNMCSYTWTVSFGSPCTFHITTKHCSQVASTPASCSGGARYKYQPTNQPYRPAFFTVLINPPGKMLVQYLKTGHNISFHILYNSLVKHPTIQCYIVSATDSVIKSLYTDHNGAVWDCKCTYTLAANSTNCASRCSCQQYLPAINYMQNSF